MKEFYVQQYVDYLILAGKSPRTIQIYKPIIESFLNFSNSKPLQVSNNDIIKFILFKEGTRSREQCKGALQHLYKGVLHKPRYLKFVPNPKREQYIPNILSQDEARKLLENISNLKHKAIINLQYYAAMRTGEVVNLKFNDIRKDGIIHIRQSKGAKDRLVPITPNLQQLLRYYYSTYKPVEYLFNGQKKPKYSSKSIQKIVKKYCKLTKITRNIRPHDLRHSRATHLHEKGVGIKFIQELLGHRKIETTQHYLHSNTTTLKNAILEADI